MQTKKSPNQTSKKNPIIVKKEKPTPSPKVTKAKKTAAKATTPKQNKSTPAKQPKESPKSVKKEESSGKTAAESETSPSTSKSTTNKPIAAFFTLKKEMKVQAAGAGHKGVDYNPAKAKYHPVDDAFWNEGDK